MINMIVILEKNKCLVKDNNLKSQLSQKGFGHKNGLDFYLDLFESLYLLERKKIKITEKNKNINTEKLKEICLKEIDNFDNKYLVFKDFVENGYIVKDGLIFGFDFRIYNKSKTKEHTHTVFVVDVKESHKPKEDLVKLIKSERLANTINTKYIIAIVDKEQNIHKIKIEKY